MEKTPKNEKSINEMGYQELLVALDKAKERLDHLYEEVEKYPEPAQRDEAKEKAFAQFDAILVMLERIGQIKRERVAEMKAGTPDREIPLPDPGDHLAKDIKPII